MRRGAVAEQRVDRRGERAGVAGRHEEASPAMLYDLGYAAGVGPDRRHAEAVGLLCRVWYALVKGWLDKDVGRGEPGHGLLPRQGRDILDARPDGRLGLAQHADSLLRAVAPDVHDEGPPPARTATERGARPGHTLSDRRTHARA